MQGRICASILLMSCLSVILNYQVKAAYVDLTWVSYGSLFGLIIMEIFCRISHASTTCKKSLLLIPKRPSFLNSHIYFWIGGLFLGACTGYQASVVNTLWDKIPAFKVYILLSHCGVCVVCLWGLFLVDNSKGPRKIFDMVYEQDIEEVQNLEFFSTLLASIVLADYAGTLMILYSGFFIVLWYSAYLIFMLNTTVSTWALIGFCVLNFSCNTYRYFFHIKPYREKMRKEAEEAAKMILPTEI